VPKAPSVELVKMKTDKDKAEGSKIEEMPEIFSPSIEVTTSKTQRSSATTPKRRRMASVLDVVLETTKFVSCTPSRKIAEASKAQPKAEIEQAEVEAGPSEPTKVEPAVVEEKAAEQIVSEEAEAAATEASKENTDYIIRHASGKRLSEKEKLEALTVPKN
jgi:hypothetical protein